MPAISIRDAISSGPGSFGSYMNPTLQNTLYGLAAAVVLVSLFASIYLSYRVYKRRAIATKYETLPQYSRNASAPGKFTILRQSSVTIGSEKNSKQSKVRRDSACSDVSSLSSPVPQIQITFPDDDLNEKDEKQSLSKVVIARFDDKGRMIGCESLADSSSDSLPPYETERHNMVSLDLERLGGLKE